MEYEITPQRQAYLDARGYTILNACPGSGKTTSIVKKLFAVSRYCKEQYGYHTGFVCLSFTNTACDELKLKYRKMHGEGITFPNEVLTIDSFITQYVVLPFWHLCSICKKRPVIVNEKEALERIYYNNVLIDGEWKQCLAAGFRPYKTIIHKKTPSSITRNMNSYEWNNHLVTDPFELEYCEKAL